MKNSKDILNNAIEEVSEKELTDNLELHMHYFYHGKSIKIIIILK